MQLKFHLQFMIRWKQLEILLELISKAVKNLLFKGFWEAACSPADSEVRGTLPSTRTREWFVKTFCNNQDPRIKNNGDIWPALQPTKERPFVGRFNLYDPMNLVSSIPKLRDKFFIPTVVTVNDIKHLIMGSFTR